MSLLVCFHSIYLSNLLTQSGPLRLSSISALTAFLIAILGLFKSKTQGSDGLFLTVIITKGKFPSRNIIASGVSHHAAPKREQQNLLSQHANQGKSELSICLQQL